MGRGGDAWSMEGRKYVPLKQHSAKYSLASFSQVAVHAMTLTLTTTPIPDIWVSLEHGQYG